MKKNVMMMIAMAVAAGISSVSAAEIDFDGAKGLPAGSLREMVAAAPGIEVADVSMPSAEAAPFMNEEACSVLEGNFFVQPSKGEAVETLKPCLAAISGKYKTALKLVPGEKGLNLLVGDAKNPGNELRAALHVQLAKANGQFFGHKVAIYVPRVRAAANRGWFDDLNTVVEYVEENTAIDGALNGAAVGAAVGMGTPLETVTIVGGAIIGAVMDAADDK